MILHVPHSSDTIPEQFRDQFVLSDAELRAGRRAIGTVILLEGLSAFPGRFNIQEMMRGKYRRSTSSRTKRTHETDGRCARLRRHARREYANGAKWLGRVDE
jgi:hypothetical protein